MANERIISQADLSFIERNLSVLANNINIVSEQVNDVKSDVATVYSQVEQLANEFREFVENDLKAKELQLAETRIVKIRQEIKDKFGYCEEVRRYTTGILQATDISVVKKETISNCTEELMMAAPKYWLAPCLIALAAWINDDRELADRALREALRRDDEKTSVLFALICRRVGRLDACLTWLERYLSMQDPTNMERKMVVILDAFANGLFGGDTNGICSGKIKAWIDELAERPGFVETQQQQWSDAITGKEPPVPDSDYQFLSKHSSTWEAIKNSLAGARLHNIIYEHFKNIFESKLEGIRTLVEQVDNLLHGLVTDFDNEELPLRREELFMQLIINARGDRKYAEKQFASQQTAYDEKLDFTQLLTNAAMNPELAHASKATQKLSIALSQEWIIKAYEDIVAKNRMKVPLDIEIKIDDWSGTTRDGSNEQELAENLNSHITDKLNDALAGIKNVSGLLFGLIGGSLVGLLGLFQLNLFFLLLAAGGLTWFFISNNNVKKKKEETNKKFAEYREGANNLLKAILAEVVDYRQEYTEKDAESSKVLDYLNSITPSQYVMSIGVKSRQVI